MRQPTTEQNGTYVERRQSQILLQSCTNPHSGPKTMQSIYPNCRKSKYAIIIRMRVPATCSCDWGRAKDRQTPCNNYEATWCPPRNLRMVPAPMIMMRVFILTCGSDRWGLMMMVAWRAESTILKQIREPSLNILSLPLS